MEQQGITNEEESTENVDAVLEEEESRENLTPDEEKHREEMIKAYEKENGKDEEDESDEEETEEQSTDKEDSSTKDKLEGLPENFKNVEDLVKSYKDLQKSHTQKAQELAELKKEGVKPKEESKDVPEVSAGSLIDRLTADLASTGSVTQETAEAFNKAGYTPEQFSTQLKSTQAYLNQAKQEAFTITEGQENYNAMLDWASENLSSEDIEVFNTSLTHSEAMAKFAIKGLYSQYKTNKPPSNLVKPSTGTTGDSKAKGFQSWDQVTKAMSDPRYKQGDQDYIKEVQRKMAKSNLT